MNPEIQAEARSVRNTLALTAIAAAAVVGVTLLVLPGVPQPKHLLAWDYPAADLTNVIFEIVSKTNLNSPWQFYTNVVGTNRMPMWEDKPQEFFTISKVMDRNFTNVAIKQKGFK